MRKRRLHVVSSEILKYADPLSGIAITAALHKDTMCSYLKKIDYKGDIYFFVSNIRGDQA